MRRIVKPLDPAAIRAADEKIYASHANDARANALYDAGGNRLKLSATDPSQQGLRDEWWEYYFEAFDARQKASEDPPPSAATRPDPLKSPDHDERDSTDVVQPCPYNHFVAVLVVEEFWDSKRLPYWPPYRSSSVYDSEPYVAQITNGKQVGKLIFGNFRYYGIPAGVCSFRLVEDSISPILGMDILSRVAADIGRMAEYESDFPQPKSCTSGE